MIPVPTPIPSEPAEHPSSSIDEITPLLRYNVFLMSLSDYIQLTASAQDELRAIKRRANTKELEAVAFAVGRLREMVQAEDEGRAAAIAVGRNLYVTRGAASDSAPDGAEAIVVATIRRQQGRASGFVASVELVRMVRGEDEVLVAIEAGAARARDGGRDDR